MNNIVGLRLEFDRESSAATREDGSTVFPANAFRFARNRVCKAVDEEILAIFHAREWTTQGQRFTRFQCKGTSVIHFESAAGEVSRCCGPFDDVRFEEGAVRVAHGQLFASYHEQRRLWHSFVLSSDWPVMILTAAEHGRICTGSSRVLSIRSR